VNLACTLGRWAGSTRFGGITCGTPSARNSTLQRSAVGSRPGSTMPWWWSQTSTRFVSDVSPPAHHGFRWWAWQAFGGLSQPGKMQPPSRSSSAARIGAVTSRWVRPTSNNSDYPPSTAGMRSASHSHWRNRPAGTG